MNLKFQIAMSHADATALADRLRMLSRLLVVVIVVVLVLHGLPPRDVPALVGTWR